MSLTFQQARIIVQQHVADSSNSTFVDQCLDQAVREVARARRWPELMVRDFFNTAAAYETGTVAVTEGGTTWTLTGGTFPTAAATGLYRIALSISDPWYEITTRTDDTHVVTDAYQDDTETAASYVAYKSHYSMPSAVDRIESIWLHSAGTAYELRNAATDERVTEFAHYPSGPGIPTHFYNMERDSSGNRQILVGPETPDDIYRVEYVYRKKASSGDLIGNMDDSRWPVILARTLSLAYAPEFYERSVAEYRKYQGLLAEEWSHENESEVQSVRVGQSRVNYPYRNDMEYLIGNGRIVYPSP